jgi:hypothetical protein
MNTSFAMEKIKKINYEHFFCSSLTVRISRGIMKKKKTLFPQKEVKKLYTIRNFFYIVEEV